MNIIHSKCSFCGKQVSRRKQTKNVRIHFCDLTCKSEYQKLAKPVTKEWLTDHYIVKRLDTSQIAKLVNRNPKSVWNWLKDFSIPTRKRGTTGNGWKSKGAVNPFLGKHHSKNTRNKLRAIAISQNRVPYHRHIGSYMKGRKGDQCPNWKGGVTPERQSAYNSLEWRKCVKTVWKRDNGTCQLCNLVKSKMRHVPFDIHHIQSFAVRETRFDPDNLVLLCEPCHYFVHSKRNTGLKFIKFP